MSSNSENPPGRRLFRLRTFHWTRIPDWTGVWPTHACAMRIRGRETLWRTDQHSLHLVLSGCVRFQTERAAPADLPAGHVFLVDPGRAFCYYGEDSALVHLLVVRLAGPMTPAYVRTLGFEETRPAFPAADPKAAERILRRIFRLTAETSPTANHKAVGALYDLPSPFGGVSAENLQDDLATRFQRRVHRHLEAGENVDEIARHLGVSRSSLFLHVRERFDSSPTAMLISARLARAKLLLETTDHSAAEIARLSGYRSPEHFHRQFCKLVSATPQVWRTHMRAPQKPIIPP